MVVTGFYSAMRVKKEKLSDQRILFLGAGSAATGIAHLIADAMVEEGTPREEALKKIALFDSKGLVSSRRSDKLAANKVPFAHDLEVTASFADAIRLLKPTAIVGVSAQPKTFNEEVVSLMAEYNDKPIVFALSNPTSKAECTAEEAYKFSKGKALFACGSPFAPLSTRARPSCRVRATTATSSRRLAWVASTPVQRAFRRAYSLPRPRALRIS